MKKLLALALLAFPLLGQPATTVVTTNTGTGAAVHQDSPTFTTKILLPDGTDTVPSLGLSGHAGVGFHFTATAGIWGRGTGVKDFAFAHGAAIPSDGTYCWSSSATDATAAAQACLANTAGVISATTGSLQANTMPPLIGGTNLVEQRNSTNGQKFEWYKTYTSATNFERVFIDAAGDPLAYHIGSEYGSTGGSPRQLILGGGSVTTDVAPELRQVQGKSAIGDSTATNKTGGNLILAGGLGTYYYTFVTPNSTGGKTFTITANGTAVVLTEGVDFNCNTLTTTQCAANLASAINANGTLGPLMTANGALAICNFTKKTTLYSLTLATNAGAPAVATNGTNGEAMVAGYLAFNGTTSSFPAMRQSTVSGTKLAARLADNSAYTYCEVGGLDVYSATNRVGIINGGNFQVASGGYFGFGSSSTDANTLDTILTRRAAATLQLGAADAAAPVAQTLGTQGSRGGTDTDVAGANLTIQSGLGTGAAAASSIVFATPTVVSTGSVQQTAATRLTIATNAVTVTPSLVTNGGLNGNGTAVSGYGYGLSANTGDATLSVGASQGIQTNTGAGAAVTLTLPNDPARGWQFTFCATVAQDLIVAPGAGETLYDGGTAYSSVKVNGAANCMVITCIKTGAGGIWAVTSKNGTVTDTP